MRRERWDEMQLQEDVEEQAPLADGHSYGEGTEHSRRPIGFGHAYRGRIEEAR